MHPAASACPAEWEGGGNGVLLSNDLKMAALGELSHFLSYAELS